MHAAYTHAFWHDFAKFHLTSPGDGFFASENFCLGSAGKCAADTLLMVCALSAPEAGAPGARPPYEFALERERGAMIFTPSFPSLVFHQQVVSSTRFECYSFAFSRRI